MTKPINRNCIKESSKLPLRNVAQIKKKINAERKRKIQNYLPYSVDNFLSFLFFSAFKKKLANKKLEVRRR